MIVRRSDDGTQQAISKGFETVAEQYLSEFGIQGDIPIIVCGMAGAKQGWREASYINTPTKFEEIISNSVSVPHRSRDIRILPGICQRNLLDPDIMRGKETQLLGLLEHLPENGLICMPGNHSKWVKIGQKRLEHFSTFMTGEIFGILAGDSILKLQGDVSLEIIPSSHAFHRAFNETVENPSELTNRLFKTHSSRILGYSSPDSNAAVLSGCLLGLEFAGAQSKYGQINEVSLIASSRLGKLYESALNSRGVSVNRFDAEEAVVRGLYKAATTIWPIK